MIKRYKIISAAAAAVCVDRVIKKRGCAHNGHSTYTSLAGRFLPSTILKYKDVFLAIVESSDLINPIATAVL